MSKYFITGVSRGIGFAILQQVSSNPENTVVGLVRDRVATEKRINEELPERKNIHIVQGDLLDYSSLKSAVEETSKITGGELDYVIANAAVFPQWSFFQPLGVLGKEPEKLEEDIAYHIKGNVTAQIHIFNLTMPLILKGKTKKIMAVSSGQGDYLISAKYDLALQAPYAISKGALDVAVAKFSAQYANEGVLLMSVSPGFVDTGLFKEFTEEQAQIMAGDGAKFARYNPRIKGPTTPEVAAAQMLGVIERASVDAGDGGTSVSQFGNRQWF